MLKKVVKAVLFKLSKLIVIAFFLLVSEQVFAHENHSFFEFQPTGYNQSFFDDDEKLIEKVFIETTFTHNTVCKQFSISDMQQAQNKFFFAFSFGTEPERITFQNYILVLQLSHNNSQDITTLQQIEEECNCLNDCSCLECQCADCPMSVSCSAVSVVFPKNTLVSVESIHQQLITYLGKNFTSQPHTLPFRPPITL